MRCLITKSITKTREAILRLRDEVADRVNNFGEQYIAFGVFGIVNYPIFYFVWISYSNSSYESLSLRVIATLLCLLLVLNKKWPHRLKLWLPLFWYFTLLFCLPFFFFFMLLKNHGSNVWLMSSNTILFWLLLMVDWISYIYLLGIGFFLACLVYFISEPDFIISIQVWWGVIIQFIASIVVVIFFASRKQQFDNQKLQAIRALGERIAHELRTPLRTINTGATGLKEHLPLLIETYHIAKNTELKIPYLDPMHYEAMVMILDNIESETDYAFKFIEMLLINAKPSKLGGENQICSIINCVEQALTRYPFSPGEKDLVHWEFTKDFYFKGDNLLITHVLFNLLKNAIYYVKAANKGNIYITLSYGKKYNLVLFKDTGQGIPAKILPKIFDNFFSSTRHGTGIGLAFCKMVMQRIGGNITCRSEEGKYTEFILSFPTLS